MGARLDEMLYIKERSLIPRLWSRASVVTCDSRDIQHDWIECLR